MKALLVVGIVTYAFFKFAWSYRLSSYVIILIGACPDPTVPGGRADEDALRAWSMNIGA